MAQDFRIRLQPLPERPHRPEQVPDLDREEAAALATVEHARLLALLNNLATEEWYRPTACTGWTVRDIVAHLCGVHALYVQPARWWPPVLRASARGSPATAVDRANQVAVDARADKTPAELIEEIATLGPRSIRLHYLWPAPLKRLPIYVPGTGIYSLAYVLDVMFSREFWLHRIDICRATDREPDLTADHDGRILALVMRDLATSLPARLGNNIAVRFELTGPAGGQWDFGPERPPEAVVRLDAVDFVYVSAGRIPVPELRRAGRLEAEGNEVLGVRALVLSQAVY